VRVFFFLFCFFSLVFSLLALSRHLHGRFKLRHCLVGLGPTAGRLECARFRHFRVRRTSPHSSVPSVCHVPDSTLPFLPVWLVNDLIDKMAGSQWKYKQNISREVDSVRQRHGSVEHCQRVADNRSFPATDQNRYSLLSLSGFSR